MLSNERRVSVRGRELPALEETDRKWGHVRPELQRRRHGRRAAFQLAELRIDDVTGVAVRKTVVRPDGVEPVELAVRHVVTEHVATIVGEPELVILRRPGE